MSLVQVLFSLFRSHNETMNIWTHLLGTVLFVFLFYLTYAIPISSDASVSKVVGFRELIQEELHEMKYGTGDLIPRWPITIFVFCAIFCLLGSTTFHSFLCCSKMVRGILQTIDYCGISVLISGSYFPVIIYTFFCYPKSLKFHLFVVVTINIVNVSIMATPTFRQPKYRAVRAASFTVVACYAVFSLIHIYLLDGFDNIIFQTMKYYILGMGSTYILGAFLYGSRIPEKYWPGYFDYVVAIRFAAHF